MNNQQKANPDKYRQVQLLIRHGNHFFTLMAIIASVLEAGTPNVFASQMTKPKTKKFENTTDVES